MTKIFNLLTNIIYIIFPFLCYIIYIAYCNNTNKKENNLLLSVVLFISMYLSARQEQNTKLYIPLMLNIPLLIAYIKNKKECVIIMSSFIIINYYITFNLSLEICIVEYLIYFILYVIQSKFKKNKLIYIIEFCLLKITINTIQMSIINSTTNEIMQFITYSILFILSTMTIIYLLQKSEEIVNLNITIKELQKEKQLRSSLFNIAHEIKNPLAVCKGYLEMMDFKNKNHEKYITIIQNELNRSITLMNDMLNLTKIKIVPDYIDISILLDDIKTCIEPLTINKNIKINMNISKEEIYLYADYTRLKQVFIDVIKNSIDTFDKMAKEKTINIKIGLKKNKIITKIEDNGKGLTKEELKNLNEPFYKSDSKNKGLTMTLANEIIKCHKGEIEFQSKVNKGNTTIITLPLTN